MTAGTTLVHSKLTMGHGKCQSEEELDGIIDKISAQLAQLAEEHGGGRD